MPTREEWEALAVRCEGAEGSDREIDLVMAKLSGAETSYISDEIRGTTWFVVWRDAWPRRPKINLPTYTASVDAILGLIAEKLPGWRYRFGHDDDGVYRAAVYRPKQERMTSTPIGLQNGVTPALALCAAFCRAMATQEGRTDG